MFTLLEKAPHIHVHLHGDRLPTCRHTALALCCHRLQQRGGGTKQNKKKNTPMTLKSFYSHNHRLPSPWIRAVTPAPACLPPQLPKLPAGRQTGRLPSYCQGGQKRGRTGWERFNASHTHSGPQRERKRLRKTAGQTDRERERNTGTSRERQTQTTHSLPAQLRYAHSQIHSHTFFPIQTQRSGSQGLPDLQEYSNHTDRHKSQVHTPKF